MASSLWYLYEFARKKWIKKFVDAKSEESSYIPPERYRKVPPVVEFPERCISCEACKESCPAFAIELIYNESYNKKLPKIDEGSCIACANCVEACPTGVLEIDKHRAETEGLFFDIPKYTNLIIDEEVCVRCGNCERACPVNVIKRKEGRYVIDRASCISCKECIKACPIENAIVVFDERTLKEKIEKAFEIKNKIIIGKLEVKENVIEEIPHIVDSLCITCGTCKDVCIGEIDLKEKKVVECVKCGLCIEVCPTTAIRTHVPIIPKRKDICYVIDEDLCIGCRICQKVCHVNAVKISKEIKLPYIVPELCVACGACERECPVGAIRAVKPEEAKEAVKRRIIEDKIIENIEEDLISFTEKYGKVMEEIEKLSLKKMKEELKRKVHEERRRIKEMKRELYDKKDNR
ncbi:4Fe-4S binding protein [Methanocaldococcus fervens]|uniref:4Fe-4S ferredoxin iron-sulfur binding domain protein n=1 Tax=Methanocaldococcus fervens (strain DSM 4213 / JCM 15782 / AG86) TaxID=573064 RepID=C7P6I8_METFA|nr:4Fe-4S binding protein [Methanocaldococcus fervens]ACV24170.1 4Fe-4S ferredoxin iron-sulfur binding domain protein [Methanocaldococcus fervens AG86]